MPIIVLPKAWHSVKLFSPSCRLYSITYTDNSNQNVNMFVLLTKLTSRKVKQYF